MVGCLPGDWLFDISGRGDGGTDLAVQLAGCDDVDELLRLLRLQPPPDYVISSGGSGSGSSSDAEGLAADSDSVRQSDRRRDGSHHRSGGKRHHVISNRSQRYSTDEDAVDQIRVQADTQSDRHAGVRRLSDRLTDSNEAHEAERFRSRGNRNDSDSDDGIEIERVSFVADEPALIRASLQPSQLRPSLQVCCLRERYKRTLLVGLTVWLTV